MDKKEIYNFTYKGILCEIVHWGLGEFRSFKPGGIWNAYIYIKKENIPDRFTELLCKSTSFKITTIVRKNWDYWKLDDIFDFHGGITYYELIRDEYNGSKRAVKVGCDYAHLYDDEQVWNEEVIKKDLEKAVDSFITHFPEYVVQSPKTGNYIKYQDIEKGL